MLNNQIVGPRTHDRPVPLMRGDPAQGLRPACAVPWNVLNPKNVPLAIEACAQHGSLLQIKAAGACGAGSDRVWISSRWVITMADLRLERERIVVCQQLETGVWAGTRAFTLRCEPRKPSASDVAAPRTEPPKDPGPP